MKVLMLGWEFPPHISGGLGTACHGLLLGLDSLGVDVCFVMPRPIQGAQRDPLQADPQTHKGVPYPGDQG